MVNITNTSPYAVANNFMANGSLTIGDMLLNYGNGTNWNTNTAGLLMECLNNTEIAIHDAGSRVISALQYLGGTTSTIVLGRNMGWGEIGTILLNGNVGIGTGVPNSKLDVNGAITSSGAINANGNSLIFPETLSDYKIKLYTGFGFGVQSGELKYTSGGAHKFRMASLAFGEQKGGL